jgi:hypothetical protein
MAAMADGPVRPGNCLRLARRPPGSPRVATQARGADRELLLNDSPAKPA